MYISQVEGGGGSEGEKLHRITLSRDPSQIKLVSGTPSYSCMYMYMYMRTYTLLVIRGIIRKFLFNRPVMYMYM